MTMMVIIIMTNNNNNNAKRNHHHNNNKYPKWVKWFKIFTETSWLTCWLYYLSKEVKYVMKFQINKSEFTKRKTEAYIIKVLYYWGGGTWCYQGLEKTKQSKVCKEPRDRSYSSRLTKKKWQMLKAELFGLCSRLFCEALWILWVLKAILTCTFIKQ